MKLFYLAFVATTVGVLVISISELTGSLSAVVVAVACAFYLAAAALLTKKKMRRE